MGIGIGQKDHTQHKADVKASEMTQIEWHNQHKAKTTSHIAKSVVAFQANADTQIMT